MERKINVVEDLDGNKIVFIHDIRFKGKRSVEWSDVEEYLKKYVGEIYVIQDTKDMVYIGSDLPDEYAHSNYTMLLKGANAKAKANATQGLPELLEIANEKEYEVWLSRKDSGVPISEPVQLEMIKVRDELGLTQYKFPWE